MKEENIDQLITSKLDGHESQVPAHIWKRIEEQIGSKRRHYLVLVILLLTVILGASALYYQLNEGPNPNHQSTTNQELNQTANQELGGLSHSTDQNLESNIEKTETKSIELFSTPSSKLFDEKNENAISPGQEQKLTNQQKRHTDKGGSQKAMSSDQQSNVDYGTAAPQLAPNEKTLSTVGSHRSEVSNTGTNNDDETDLNQTENVPAISNNEANKTGKMDETKSPNLIVAQLNPQTNQIEMDQNETNQIEVEQSFIESASDVSQKKTNDTKARLDIDRTAGGLDHLVIEKIKKDGIFESDVNQESSRSIFRTPVTRLDRSKSGPRKKIRPTGDGGANSYLPFIYDPCSVRFGKKNKRLECYEYVKQNELIFADFSIGPLYSHKILKKNAKELGSDDLLNERESTESYGLSFNISARMGIKAPGGITGMIGLSYERFNEKFEYYNPNDVRNITTTVPTIIIGPDGNEIMSTTTITIQSMGARTVNHSNSLTFINLPVTAGYTWQSKKLNVGLHGGMDINLLFSKSGRILDGNDNVEFLDDDYTDKVFKNRAGICVIAGLIVEFKMNKNISLFAEPRLKYHLRNLAVVDYGLEQKYFSAGINFGVRTILNKTTSYKKEYQ